MLIIVQASTFTCAAALKGCHSVLCIYALIACFVCRGTRPDEFVSRALETVWGRPDSGPEIYKFGSGDVQSTCCGESIHWLLSRNLKLSCQSYHVCMYVYIVINLVLPV